ACFTLPVGVTNVAERQRAGEAQRAGHKAQSRDLFPALCLARCAFTGVREEEGRRQRWNSPSGRSDEMKTALHTVSYAGVWPGQMTLPLERIVDKAAELGYDGVMIVAKRPHASPLD